jgi:hypothetical protein
MLPKQRIFIAKVNGVMLVFWQAKTESKLDTYVQKLAFSFFDHLN